MSIQLIHAFGDASHDGVLAVNEFGRITFANEIAANALDCEREKLINQPIDDFLHFESDAAASTCCTWADLRARRAHHGCRGRLVRRDGAALPIRFNIVPLPPDSQLKGAIIAFRHVFEHVAAQQDALEAEVQEDTFQEDSFLENRSQDYSSRGITHYFSKRRDNLLDTSAHVVEKRTLPRDGVEQVRAKQPLANSPDVDRVTSLMSRSDFQNVLEREMRRAARANETGGLLYIDLDDFYAVNDAFGHQAGDDVLRHVSHVLQDIMPADAIVARVGGDEFGVFLPDASAEQTVAAGRRLLAALNEPAACATDPIYVRASVGVATFSDDDPASAADEIDATDDLADDLLMRAHAAMRAAKQAGGQRVVPYSSALVCHAMRKVFEWDRRCRAALRNDRFVLHRQPLVDVQTSKDRRLGAAVAHGRRRRRTDHARTVSPDV